MGSGVSKSDANGAALPARFRPVFLQRLEEFTSRRHNRPLKHSSTLSKKELLLHDRDDNDNASHHSKTTSIPHEISPTHCKKSEEAKRIEAEKLKHEAFDKEGRVAMSKDTKHDVVKVESLKANGNNDQKENVAKEEDVFKDFDDDDDNDDDDDSERMIGHKDGEAFPGSPSFRVYFKDNGADDHNDIGKDDSFESKSPSEDAVTPKESSVRKQAKRSKKRRSFKKVFPKGGQAAVKNLLNVTSCYTQSRSSQERNLLLTYKT